jgi:hypothetical protein
MWVTMVIFWEWNGGEFHFQADVFEIFYSFIKSMRLICLYLEIKQ